MKYCLVVLDGPDDTALLDLARVGDGRVGLFLTDQLWLWPRGYQGGGPYLDLLRRLKKKTQGDAGTIETAVQEINKLEQTMSSDTFGAATKVKQQLIEIKKIQQLAASAVGKTAQFNEQKWDEVADWDTKVRQSFEIAKANYRLVVKIENPGIDQFEQRRGDKIVFRQGCQHRGGDGMSRPFPGAFARQYLAPPLQPNLARHRRSGLNNPPGCRNLAVWIHG